MPTIDLRWSVRHRRLVWPLCLVGTIAFSPAHALCGGPLDQNNFRRPIDVNNPADREKVNIVVQFHFTPEVAALIRGTTVKLPGDIHYTLRHIPNHYGALDSMARF